ncbi:MAG: class B sortase [Lachnospiraceae bacterium]|nr:class B sortase [Lachnospiraceae bacterium]
MEENKKSVIDVIGLTNSQGESIAEEAIKEYEEKDRSMKIAKAKENVKKFYFILMILCLTVFVGSLIKLITIQLEYKKGVDTYDDIANEFVVVNPTESPENTANQRIDIDDAAASFVTPQTPAPIQKLEVNFDKLKDVNEDIIGWIYSYDTAINYPIVQGEDNDYYLKHLFNKKSNKAGSIFMDAINNRDFTDDNTMIYGHHMNNGSMFASLSNYKSQSYYEAHPYIYIVTPDKDYRIEVFSGYVTDFDSEAYTVTFADDESKEDFIKKVKKKSSFKSKVEVSAEDYLITLSTCDYTYKNARYAVHGKLVPIESAKGELGQ